MKIVLCTKQVPSVEDVRFDREKGTIIREGVPNEINPFDRRALGSALELKQQFGAEVVAVTMGPPQAQEVLWECLAIGADRAIHINDRALAGSDTLATARVLAALLKREQPDIVFCGKYSVDADTGQVGPEVAAMLGIPQVTGATSLKLDGDGTTATVARETDAGIDTLEVKLPVLLTASERLTRPPRFDPATLEAAKAREIETITVAHLGLGAHEVGFAGSPTSVCGIDEVKPHRIPVVVEERDPVRASERVIELLRERHVFDSIREDLELEPLPEPPANPRDDRSIWVVPELIGGRLAPVTFELLGGAASVAQEVDGQVCAVLIGHQVNGLAAELAERGADVVYVADDPRLAQFDSETYSWVLAQAARVFNPWAILIPATSQGRDYAPRVAGELGLGLTGDAVGLEVDAEGRLAQLKPAFGGTIVATILTSSVPQMLTVRAGMLRARAPRVGARATISPLSLEGLPAPRARLIQSAPAEEEGGRLDEAEVIVCAGAGLGGADNLRYVEELAEAVHGVVGGTRRVVDSGWLPRQRQIGLTGVIVAPELYIGVGVRGAFNHAIGIQRAGTVVAINTDPDALIMQQADIAVVGDYHEVVPALAEAFRRSTAVAAGD